MGSVVKGVASLFGGRGRRREQKKAGGLLDTATRNQDAFKMSNVYSGLQGPNIESSGYDPITGESVTLGEAGQTGIGTLRDSRGYTSEGYTSRGYDAAQTDISGLQRGANTGLTNTMNNLQVSTAGAEMAAQEADQSLAASQDLAAQAGTGAGGATALAAAAAKSKQGISADIDRQVKANEQMRARGESELQRSQLAQGNVASQFDLGQSQFNVGAENQAAQFGAQAYNQAAQFGAGAKNQAAQFGAGAANQFSLAQFGAENRMNEFNTSATNQFAQSRFGAENQFGMNNMNAQNRALEFGASAANRTSEVQGQYQFSADTMRAQQEGRMQEFEFDKLQDKTGRAMARKNAADGARAAAKADLIGGIAGIADAAVSAATGGMGAGAQKWITSDRRLKKDIKLIGLSPSGLKIYSFKYKDSNFGNGLFQGVMSDEIPNSAVIKHTDGFDRVDYSRLDVEFKNI